MAGETLSSGDGGLAGDAGVAGAGGEAGAVGGGLAGAGGEAGASAEPKATDGFDASVDGWTITGDAQASSVAPDYVGVGGNPDGMISAVDDVAGGVWYFTAPEKYLGDNSALYGMLLSFDLQVTPITTPFSSPDVELIGGGITLAFDCSFDPGQTWTSYEVPLSEAGWKVGSLSGADATEAELRSVLAATTSLRIRGEFNEGSDTGQLDNVAFGVPE